MTLSSAEAEFVAMSTAATEIKFVVSVLTEIHRTAPTLPSILKEDNTGAIYMAKNHSIGQRTKHVDVRHRFVNDMVTCGDLLVDHIRSEDNPGDTMTKNVQPGLHERHAEAGSEGKFGSLYEAPSTEDVGAHETTVLVLPGIGSAGATGHFDDPHAPAAVNTAHYESTSVPGWERIRHYRAVADTCKYPASHDTWTVVPSKGRLGNRSKTRLVDNPGST